MIFFDEGLIMHVVNGDDECVKYFTIHIFIVYVTNGEDEEDEEDKGNSTKL